MLLNELAQWAALLFLGIFVLGLTRQLGDFLVPSRERVAENRGPKIGKRLPAGLLPAGDHRRLLELMEERAARWAALLVVSEDCPRCKTLIERLAETGAPDHAPVVALSSRSGPDHTAVLEATADIVVVDGKSLEKADINVRPFVLIVDRTLKVRHKQIAWDLHEAVHAWTGGDEESGNGTPMPTPEDRLTIVHAGGEGS